MTRAPGGREVASADWYRLADGFLAIRSQDNAFRRRFLQIYERFPAAPSDGLPRIECQVTRTADPERLLVRFQDPVPLDLIAFANQLFLNRMYVEGPRLPQGWRVLRAASGDAKPLILVRGNDCLVDRGHAWQPLLANVAVNRLLRAQRNVLFFHAGSLVIRGSGVLLVGPKQSGKTTLSLALAARGHGFFGDEVAAVRVGSRELVPFRRAISMRPGPAAQAIEAVVRSRRFASEIFPDGGVRLRAHYRELLSGTAAASAPLRAVFLLQGFAEKPSLLPCRLQLAEMARLALLPVTFWGWQPGQRAVQLLKILSAVQVYGLVAGLPDDTAAMIDSFLEAQ